MVYFIIIYYALLFIIIFLCISLFLDFFLEILQLEKKTIITTRPACHVTISASTQRLSRGFGQPGGVKRAPPSLALPLYPIPSPAPSFLPRREARGQVQQSDLCFPSKETEATNARSHTGLPSW